MLIKGWYTAKLIWLPGPTARANISNISGRPWKSRRPGRPVKLGRPGRSGNYEGACVTFECEYEWNKNCPVCDTCPECPLCQTYIFNNPFVRLHGFCQMGICQYQLSYDPK
jgi:hypothetical protein